MITTELASLQTEQEVRAAIDIDAVWGEVTAEYQRRGNSLTTRPTPGTWGDRAMTLGSELRAALLHNDATLDILRDLRDLLRAE